MWKIENNMKFYKNTNNAPKIKKIRFTNAELKWIERTADIESAMIMRNFTNLMEKTNLEKLNKAEKEMCKKLSKELIDCYLFLKELRIKLEMWDCRYDIESEVIQQIKEKK